jgi:DNA adenine methylase
MTEAMKFFDPPPVRYLGSKWQLADWIITQMAPHDIYVEPYCGSASVFFRKSPASLEVINDLNGDVVNFFDVLRDRTDELVRAIDLTPYSRREFERAYQPATDDLERARRFYVRSWQGFRGGGTTDPHGWSHRTQDLSRNNASDWSRLDGLLLGARRLKQAQIECRDALEVLQRYDTPATLFYVDPPYVLRSRRRAEKIYVFEFDNADHLALAEALHRVQGMVLLSGYKSALYDELYADWHCSSKTSTTNGNGTSVEYLWSNPQATDLSRLPLFEVR